LERGVGIVVEKVLEGGPSEKSGLVEGDAIVTINGQPISGAAIAPPAEKSSSKCSRYVPSVGLTVPVACDEYLGDEPERRRSEALNSPGIRQRALVRACAKSDAD